MLLRPDLQLLLSCIVSVLELKPANQLAQCIGLNCYWRSAINSLNSKCKSCVFLLTIQFTTWQVSEVTEVSHLPSHLDLCALSLRPQTELKPRQIRWSRKSEPGNIGKATEARDWFRNSWCCRDLVWHRIDSRDIIDEIRRRLGLEEWHWECGVSHIFLTDKIHWMFLQSMFSTSIQMHFSFRSISFDTVKILAVSWVWGLGSQWSTAGCLDVLRQKGWSCLGSSVDGKSDEVGVVWRGLEGSRRWRVSWRHPKSNFARSVASIWQIFRRLSIVRLL